MRINITYVVMSRERSGGGEGQDLEEAAVRSIERTELLHRGEEGGQVWRGAKREGGRKSVSQNTLIVQQKDNKIILKCQRLELAGCRGLGRDV